MKRCVVLVAVGVLCLSGSADADTLGMRKAHAAIRTVYTPTAESLNAKVHIGHCARLSPQKVSCRTRIVGHGVDCSLQVHVAVTRANYILQAHGLRCR